MNLKKYVLGGLVALIAVSFGASAMANSGKDKENKSDENRSERSKEVYAQSPYKICKKGAKTVYDTAQKTAKTGLNTALKTAQQTRKDALLAAAGDLVKIDSANAAYRTAATVAMNIQRVASDTAQTVYESALTNCKKQQLATIVAATPTPTATPFPSYSLATVATHNTASSCWTVINSKVYNLTAYVNHPGGQTAIGTLCGHDGTAAFNGQHSGQYNPASVLSGFQIGVLAL